MISFGDAAKRVVGKLSGYYVQVLVGERYVDLGAPHESLDEAHTWLMARRASFPKKVFALRPCFMEPK